MVSSPRNPSALQWMAQGPGTFQACGPTCERLPAGAYTVGVDPCGNVLFNRRQLQTDDLIDFPGSLPARVVEEIERFWGLGERFARLGFLHRRGYLFYGKQGSGKSSLVHQILSRVVAAGHVAFFGEYPPCFLQGVGRFREAEPDRPDPLL